MEFSNLDWRLKKSGENQDTVCDSVLKDVTVMVRCVAIYQVTSTTCCSVLKRCWAWVLFCDDVCWNSWLDQVAARVNELYIYTWTHVQVQNNFFAEHCYFICAKEKSRTYVIRRPRDLFRPCRSKVKNDTCGISNLPVFLWTWAHCMRNSRPTMTLYLHKYAQVYKFKYKHISGLVGCMWGGLRPCVATHF